MSAYTDKIQKLYVAYFNRPADFSGLAFWENAVANAKDPNAMLATISAQFATSAEYKATFAGMDEAHIVNQVYLNLFGRPADDLEGLTFWTQRLLNHDVTIDNVVTKIAEGAQNADKVALNNKIAAAVAFTAALDTAEKALAYSGEQANGVAKQWLSTIGDDASLKLGTDKAALDALIKDVIEHGPQPVGQSYALTAGMDLLVGTSGNDVFNAYAINTTTGDDAKNMSTFDSIDGGAGKDTLNLQVNGAFNALADLGTVKNVEIINITGNTAIVDASKFVGATAINQNGTTAGAVTKLAVGTTAGFNGATNAAINVTAAGASAAVSFTNVAEGSSLFVDGTKLNAVTISGTRADSDDSGDVDALDLHVQAGKDVQSVAVNSTSDIVLTLDETTTSTKHVATVDASASAGAVQFDATGMTDIVTIKTGAGADKVTIVGTTAKATSTTAAVNASVSTGAGNDTIIVSTTGDGLTSVDAGAGNDKITVNKVNGAALNIQAGDGNDTVTINGVLATTDVINGGAGTDTIAMAGAATRSAGDYIVFNKMVTGFETIKFTGTTGEGALDASKLNPTYTTIDLNNNSVVTGVGSQALVANGSLTATTADYGVTATNPRVGTLNITEKATGTVTANAEIVNLAVKAAATGDVAATLAGDVKTAVVTLTNSVDDSTDPVTDTIASVTVNNSTTVLKELTSLTLTGNGSASVTNAAGTKLATVDASALGGTLSDDSVTAGLTYVSNNARAETIKLGSGIDHVTLNASTQSAVDSVVGLHLVLATGGATLATGSDTLVVTGVVGTSLKAFTTTQTDLDLALTEAAASSKGDDLVFTMNGDTYVYHDTGANNTVDANDIVVKIVGGVDLNTLIVALGGTPA